MSASHVTSQNDSGNLRVPPTVSYTLRLATSADNDGLCQLLREHPLPGLISLSYEREPDYFSTARMEGTLSQTFIMEERNTGEILGTGTRIICPMYLNGEAREVGYMGHLRANLNWPWGMSLARRLARSFKKFRELHADARVPFYLMSVIADNLPARRLLTSGLPGMPHAHAYARMFTYAISPRKPRPEIPLPGGLRLERGTSERIPAMIDCLQRNGARRQFFPQWSRETLFTSERTPNLNPQDFFLAVDGSQVVGCLALWDQTPFKQTVVRGYSGAMARARPWINLLSRFVDFPSLPPTGTRLHYGHASHLAIDQDDPQIFASLLRAIYNETARRGFNYFILGLSDANPLRPVLSKSYLHITYPSQLYLMAWEDGLDAIAQVDGRIPGIEIAIL